MAYSNPTMSSPFVPGLLPRKKTDRRFLAASAADQTFVLPSYVDLRPQFLTASDQGPSSKCAAYAMAGWLEFFNWKFKGDPSQINPDPIYRRAKELDGFPQEEGTTADAVVQAAQDLGLLSPLGSDRIRYLSGKNAVCAALHRYGAVLAAFTVTNNWGKATPDGWISPGGVEIGGHLVVLSGYSLIDPRPYISLQNSWGPKEGWQGFYRMDMETFEDFCNYGLVIAADAPL